MRGIEGALHVLEQVRAGRFASEVLREVGADMTEGDRTLASSLVYIVLRRQAMWRRIWEGFLGRKGGRKRSSGGLSPLVQDCLTAGTAGLLDLEHFAGGPLVNALLNHLKVRGEKARVPLVNAVLHSVGEKGRERVEKLRKSPSLEDRALWAGVPVWSLPAWEKTWRRPDLLRLFELMTQAPASALRVTPGKEEELKKLLAGAGLQADPSALSGALHLPGTVLPTALPGFDRGLVTVQTEGSILAASLVRHFYRGGLVLDMCSGRGVKAAQVLQELPEAEAECWELSGGSHASAKKELARLGLTDRAKLFCGNALEMTPGESPSLVLLDAPCSGSGTWNRKPESKWKMSWEKFDRLVAAQKTLLSRALELCAPSGIIIYITCSLLRQENENVVAEVLAEHREGAVLPSPWKETAPFHRARPWGTYIWPETPWLDGFYCCIIMKRTEA